MGCSLQTFPSGLVYDESIQSWNTQAALYLKTLILPPAWFLLTSFLELILGEIFLVTSVSSFRGFVLAFGFCFSVLYLELHVEFLISPIKILQDLTRSYRILCSLQQSVTLQWMAKDTWCLEIFLFLWRLIIQLLQYEIQFSLSYYELLNIPCLVTKIQ